MAACEDGLPNLSKRDTMVEAPTCIILVHPYYGSITMVSLARRSALHQPDDTGAPCQCSMVGLHGEIIPDGITTGCAA